MNIIQTAQAIIDTPCTADRALPGTLYGTAMFLYQFKYGTPGYMQDVLYAGLRKIPDQLIESQKNSVEVSRALVQAVALLHECRDHLQYQVIGNDDDPRGERKTLTSVDEFLTDMNTSTTTKEQDHE